MLGAVIAFLIFGLCIGVQYIRYSWRVGTDRPVWTQEELERKRGTTVTGWLLMGLISVFWGAAFMIYRWKMTMSAFASHLSFEAAAGLMVFGILLICLIPMAKVKPQLYQYLCFLKEKKEIKPTVSQKVSKAVEDLEKDFFNKKE